MTRSSPGDPTSGLEIRPPLQRRSRAAWSRVLDSGVELVEEGGYEAFTIAAVCARAGVAPAALYARVTSKDALFLAVYEHAMQRVVTDQAIFDDDAYWAGRAPADVVAAAVREVAVLFSRHAAFLRAVVLISAAHPEVNRRGSAYVRALGEDFLRRVLRVRDRIVHDDAEAAIRTSFGSVFSTLVLRTAFGAGFAGPPVEQGQFVAGLQAMTLAYLLNDPGCAEPVDVVQRF